MSTAAGSLPQPLRRQTGEWLIILVIIGLAVIWARWLQPRVALDNGMAWDGGVYVRMAAQSSAGRWTLTETEPYAHRAAVPLLVGKIHRYLMPTRSLVDVFDAVNTCAGVVAALLLYVWLGYFTPSFAHRAVALALFLASWAGPLRYNVWLPTIVDSFWWAVWCGGLVALEWIQQKRRLAVTIFCLILGLGIVVRETTIWLWVGTLAFATTFRGIRVVIVTAAVAAAAYAVSYVVLDANSLKVVYEQSAALAASRLDAAPSPLMPLALAVAFGPVLILVLGDPRGVAREIALHPYQLPMILFMVFGGTIGLTSQVRHAYWLAPFVYAALVTVLDRWRLLERRRYVVIGALIALQSVAARVWWQIPDEPAAGAPARIVWLTPWAGTGHWEDIDVWMATEVMRHIVGLQYLVTYAGLFVLLVAGGLWTHRARAKTPVSR